MRRCLPLLLLVTGACAVELTDPDDVRRHREETRNRPAPERQPDKPDSKPAEVRTTADEASTDATPLSVGRHWADKHLDDDPAWVAELVAGRPMGTPLTLLVGGEIGWYRWHIDNGTEGSDSGGSLASNYTVTYRIKPVVQTGVQFVGSLDRYQFSGGYAGAPEDPDRSRLISAGLGLVDDDNRGYWTTELEWARLRGEATTRNAGGALVGQDIDTHWRRFALVRHSLPLLVWGIEWEDLTIPTAYSLDDPDGQVIAIFDPATRWRTLLGFVGIDTTAAPIATRTTGWIPVVMARAGLGGGSLGWDERGADAIARSYGYKLDDSNTIFTARADVALGVGWQGCWRGAGIQALLGGRLRASYYSVGNGDDRNAADPDYDTLALRAHLSLVSVGAFARLTAFF